MPAAAGLPPPPAAATVHNHNEVEETEAEAAAEEEEEGFAPQGYSPLVNLDEDGEEGGGMEGGGMMMMPPPPAAGGGWGEEEEDEEEDGGEGDSEGDRREVDFESITSRILAQMEAEYTHTRAQGGDKEEVATARVASLSLHDDDDGAQNGEPAASFPSSTSPQSQAATLPPPSSSLLPPPPPRPLSPSKEEQIRRVMAGVVLSPQITPAWATGIDWEGPELKKMLARLQGE